MLLVDTHCHLYDPPLETDVEGVLRRAQSAGVGTVVVVGTDLATSRQAVALAEAHPGVRAAVGLHPDAEEALEIDELAAMLASDRVVAVGEIGLDGSRGKERIAAQMAAFRAQLALARDHGLPALIHGRDALGPVLDLLRSFGPSGPGGVLHAFAGSVEMATALQRLGFALGVAGVACRPRATRIRRMLGQVDLSWLVLETDAPYIGTLTHLPGQVEPAQVTQVCEALASIRGEPPAQVARQTTATALRLLGLD